jgi:hypothetical protein
MGYKRRGAAERAGGRELRTSRRPKREMAAGRMTDQNRPPNVQIIAGRFGTQPVDRVANILEGAGITTPFLVGAPVSKAPDRDPAAREFGAKGTKLLASGGAGAPASAVDKHGHGEWTRAGWEENINGLRRRRAVSQLQRRFWLWDGDEGGPFDRAGAHR